MSVASLQKLLVSWHTHDWQADKFSRGAYSYAPVGALDASQKMTEPVQRTLYFAGEHTDTSGHWERYTGHCAVEYGQRRSMPCRFDTTFSSARDAREELSACLRERS